MLRIGQPLYGYCGGYFGRISEYGPKRIEAIGHDWMVARDEDGKLYFAEGTDTLKFLDEDKDNKNPPDWW